MASGTDESPRTAEYQEDREQLRARERERRISGERDREAFRERDRKRRGRNDGDRPSLTNLTNAVRDVDRIGYALVRAGARAYIGTTSAIGGLILNLADSYYSHPYSLLREEGKAEEEGGRETSEKRGRTSRRGAGRYYTDFYDDISLALEDAADALADSADEFVRIQKDTRERDSEDEDNSPREERSSPSA